MLPVLDLTDTDIVKNCAVKSTARLLKKYMDPTERVNIDHYIDENAKDKKEKHLQLLKEKFEYIMPQKELLDFNTTIGIENYIKRNIPAEMMFYSYGPTQPLPEKNIEKRVEEYINKAKDARKDAPRKMFRMGIEAGKENGLIGCIVFDFEDHTRVRQYPATGDIGIFIDPNSREIKRDGKKGNYWREAFFAIANFMEYIFPYPDNIYISATTHFLNYETYNILYEGNHFNDPELTNTEHGKRKYFIVKYSDFLKVFLHTAQSRGVIAEKVKTIAILQDTE